MRRYFGCNELKKDFVIDRWCYGLPVDKSDSWCTASGTTRTFKMNQY